MKPFDEHLYTRKIQELSHWLHAETDARLRQADAEQKAIGQGLGTGWLAKRVDAATDVLREYLPKVDEACRETWLSDHEAITPDFVRKVLVPHVFTVIADRKGSTQGDLELLVVRTGIGVTGLTPALNHLAMEIGHLEAEIVNRYEIEAIKLAKQVDRNVAAVNTQIPSKPPGYFPSDLRSRPPAQSDSWKYFHERFTDLAREEQGRAVVVTKGEVLGMINKLLRASCNYRERPEVLEKGKPEQGCFCLLETPPHGIWNYSDGVSENFLERVRLCVAEAGRALPDYPKSTDAEDFWLHRLYLNLLKHNSDQLFAATREGGMIHSVCVASATFCSRLEREALAQSEPSSMMERRSAQNSDKTVKRNGAIGRNITRLRKECGWSLDQLARKTGIDKKLILSHVNKGARPIPRILKEYADAFSEKLGRKITAPDLET